MRVLVIETAFLGDAIISLGLAGELKRLQPDAHITYLVRPDSQEIALGCPDVDDALTYDKYAEESGREGIQKKAEELNEKEFDTIFLLQNSHRSQALCSMLNADRKIGFASMGRASLTHTVADSGWSNRYERPLILLRALYADANIGTLPRLTFPIIPHISQFIGKVGRPVVIAPGSVRATKKWGDEKYVALAKVLTEGSIGVIVIGAEQDRRTAGAIRNACKEGSVLELAGRGSFMVAVGAIACGSVLVCNDSAPAHAAVAVGTPVISIFGPTVPAFGFAPPTSNSMVVELPTLWCRPCTSHGGDTCPIYTHECMRDISVEQVLGKILKVEEPVSAL
jgi:heptosyltransferase-2